METQNFRNKDKYWKRQYCLERQITNIEVKFMTT